MPARLDRVINMLEAVRPWLPRDRAALVALNAELQEHERALRPSRRPGPEMSEAYIAELERQVAAKGDDAALFVAEDRDGRVLGFVSCFVDVSVLEQDAREMRIEDVVVAAPARRQGIGRALIEAAFAFAGQRDVRRVEITVISENHDAAAMYLAMGFTPARTTLERRLPTLEAPRSGS